MADANKITKIYDLSLLGADDVLKKMDAVNLAFDNAKKNFTAYKNSVKSGQTETSAAFQKAKEDLLKQQVAQKNLRAETIAYNNVLNQQKLVNKQVADSNKQVAGSYNDLAQRARALRAELKGNLVLEGVDPKKIAAGTAELKKLTDQMKHFDRSLTKDGVLVGEYTTGINRSFGALRSNLAQLALGFIGFQAIIGGLRSAFDQTIQLDSLNKSLEVVSGTTAELAINEQFLKETTELLGITLLDSGVAFKNFYAASTQAGISADETRRIFFAAASASANLKLSQEQTNGILLAFGQIASKGKVQAEELRGQIGERIPGAFSIAAKAIGVTQQQLDGMLKKGEVIASDFLPKFASELQKTFGTTDKVEGLQASINRLKNRFTELVDENSNGLAKLVNLFISLASAGFKVVKFITAIPFAVLITGIALLTAGWAYYKGNVISATLAQSFNNKESLLGIIRNAAARIGLGSKTAATIVDTEATIAAADAQKVLNVAQKASPLGIILGIIALLVPLMSAFGEETQTNTDLIDHQNISLAEQNKILADRVKLRDTKKDVDNIVIGDTSPGDQQDFARLSGQNFDLNLKDEKVKQAAIPATLKRLKDELQQANEDFDNAVLNSPEKAALKAKILKLQKEISLNDLNDKDIEKGRAKAKKTAEELLKDKQEEFLKAGLLAQKNATETQKRNEDFEIKQVTEYQNVRDARITQLKIDQSKARQLILGDLTLTDAQRTKKLEQLAKAQTRTLLTEELHLLQDEVAAKKIAFDQGIIDYKEYLDAVARLQAKAEELSANVTGSKNRPQLKTPGSQTTRDRTAKELTEQFKIGDNEQDLLGNVIADSFNTAQFAMNSYFDSEAARIDQSKKHALTKLDEEEKNALKRATTKAQEEQIQKQFDKRRETIEKEAFEKHKKLKRSEATIAYATELANIAVAAAGNPSNASTYGLSGIAMYAVLAGLATLRYGLNIGSINAQEYGEGGLPVRGGRFMGKSHAQGGIPANVANFEGDELAIVNKRAANSNRTYTVSGTPSQIASSINTVGGGVNFSPGGSMYRFADGGYIGSVLQPPVLQSYYQTSGVANMSDVKGMIKDLTKLVLAESVKPVVLSERNLTSTQNENRRRVEVGQL